MGNNLYKIEKDLRSIAKRYKSVKYSLGLAILFLMMGISAFSEDVTTEVATRQEIKNSVGNVQTKLNVLREENEEQIKKLRLELLQLMEQGDQVVKSPWSSWQFGMNYFYENWGSSYKGNGDKAQKYVFNGIYTRGNWKVRNAKDTIENARAGGKPLTPGTDSISSWKNISNSSSGGVIINKDNSINSSTNGNRNWGLVNLEDLKEPTNEVEILARISPKEVTKQAITLNITEPVVGTMEAPVINPQVNEPLPAPKIETPEIENVTINQLTINAPNAPVAPSAPVISIGITAPSAPVAPSAPNAPVAPNAPSVQSITVTPSTPSAPSAPTISITVTPPQIEALSITTPGEVGTISVTPPTINPVDFMLSPRGLSSDTNRNFLNRAYNLNGQNISVNTQGNYISTWGRATNLDGVNTNVTVTADDTRAFMIDEGIDYKDATVKPFRYIGTITLNNSKNVGIDVQGTHTKYSGETNTGPGMNQIENVANIQVINEGTIVGNGGPNVKNQVGFGFNNFDASTNNTRTEMINRGNGSVTLGAPESAGIQLRPEDPWSNSNNSQRGLNMMTGENSGTVSINSYGSFGILTVKNRDLDKFKSNPASTALAKVRDYNNYAVKSTAGGQIASRAQEANMSYIKNTGTINVNGDSSVGVGLLHNIQGVTLGGIVNVGTNNPSSFTYSDKTGGTSGKIDGAVGIYTEVETRPILNGDYDDHALQNTTGRTIGTETIEVSGNVNIGDYAIGSSGLRIKDKGSITLKNGGKINVGGENNYGAIVEGTNYDYYRKTQANAYAENGTKYTATGRVNLEQGSSINVTGKSSIAYVLKSGKGSNAGTIEVTGDKGNTATSASFNGSLGFYGVKGEFTNTGTISTKGKIAHAVALVGDLTDGITFKNNGKISVEDAGNIGVYASGKYIFEHSGTNAKISVGSNALGIYAKNSTGTLNINAPIELGNSSSGGTTIGIYSDGDAKVKFGAGSKLTIGEGAVGLYSSDATKFNNTFTIENGKSLEIVLAKNSTFGLIKGPSSTSPILSKYLNNNLTDKINITSFGEGASLFYATDSAKVTLDNDYTVTNGGAASTAVLVGTNGSTVEITSGKTLTTNTNVALIGTKGAGTASTVLNNGNINSTRDSGIGIYAQGSNVTNSGSIKIQNQKSVAILGEDDSTLTNSGKIEIEKAQSAGIYGKNSTITNSGSGTNGIFVKEGASAGIYSLLTNNTDRKITNSGLIKLEDANKESSAGIYAKLESNTNKLETENLGTIEVIQKKSVGIYAENTSSQGRAQSIVENKNSIKVSGDSSVGIIGKKSKITNSGTGTNGIEISGNNSAGILVSDNSEVTNSGRIESKTGTSLVGISVDSTSTVSNSGTITIGTDSSTGISSKGGAVTNSKDIILNNQTSVGISSENGNVTNTATTGKIEVKNKESVGIYAKLTGSSNQIIDNSGAISLITSSGTPNKSAGIYSLYENSATGTLTTTNNGTISVDQIGSVGIFVKNSSNQDKTKSIAKNTAMITVSKEGSAGMLGEKSTLENSTPNGNITLSANKTAGMIGNSKSKVTNNAGITTATATPSNSAEGLVGISLNDSEGINEATGTITLGTDYSTGMYGEAKSTLTNKGNITGNNKNAVGMATKASTATNDSTITLTGADSTGMFGLAVGTDKSTLINNKIITGTGTGTVGIVADKTTAENRTGATITLEGKKSTGIFGKQGSDITNAGKIETKTAVPSTSVEGLVGIALNASKATNTSTGTIVLGTAYSTGMFGEASSTLTNEGSISGTQNNVVGIAADNSIVTNNKNATITLEGKTSTGIFGKQNSTITNAGKIETKTINPANIGEGLVGIALNASKATNTSTGSIILGTAYSTGMFGEANSILTNEGTISGSKENSVGIAGKNSTVTNKGNVTLEGKNSTGIFGETNSTLSNNSTATITVKEESSVGIYSKNNATTAKNAGTIVTEKKSSAGMYGDEGDLENTNSITAKAQESAGMYAKNANAVNKKSIVIEGKTSAGILLELNGRDKSISGSNETADGIITVKNESSAGMLGKVVSGTTGANAKLTLTNKNTITVDSKESVGIMVSNDSILTKDKVIASNEKTITLVSGGSNNKNIGILADKKATGFNTGDINVESKESVGMLGQNASSVINNKTITLTGVQGIGMLAKDANSAATNEDTINVNGKASLGMLSQTLGDVKNNKTIKVSAENGVGIFVSGTGKGSNSIGGTITLENKENVGIFAKNNGNTTFSAENAGNIVLGKPDKSTTGTSLIGMFAQAEAGKTASVKNIGTIYVNTKSSVGMYAKNDAANTDDADLHNAGTIYVNNESSAGIYAPKAKISKIGKITLEDSTSTNGSSAVYISNGGKAVDTEQAEISLGTKNQNRVAYYINGKDSALSGTNIGKIIGYGVGVYLQGNSSTDIAKIDSNTPILNYKANGANGKGIIGLFLNGDTDIQAYNGGITVGDTVEKNGSIPGDKPKYAIGIYAKGQGTSATPYNITTAITAGKNGVGIYADNDSNIKYTGNMEIGDGTTAGTGIFITKKMGAIGGKVELGSNTIKLKGTGGVAVIASEGTTFDGKNATIELEGTNVQGVGVYAKKGSTVNISNWTFNNHGNAAEEVRSEEGGAYITANKQLKPKMVLTHVINGETSIASGITVVSVHDGKYKAEANIGLMAEGVKNPVAPAPITWQEGNFEIVNKGTIDFSVAEKSTAIFANSARAKNDGVIKVGKNSTAIYGFYDSTTRKYEGAPVNPDPNKLELETTTNSKISLGDSSTGMYLINAEKIDNKGGEIKSETGATKNVGIYAINGQDTKVANNKILIMQNAANIILGNGSVGLYSKGQSNIVRNIVTNTGNITVGDKITGSPSVAMYAENTNLNTNSNIAVGKDGIAFYGKNSTIEAKGAVNFQNKGVLAYLEDSKFISHLGNLGATQNTMIYLKNSTAQLDGAGTKADIDVADGYTGAYIEGNSTLTGIKTIKLGKDSTGLYLKDASFISNAESITGTKNKARGILATNSNLINNSKISLSGEESVGIYSNADNTKTVINNGELTLAGKKTLGVFLKGSQSFENKANINIADSTNSKEPIIGIYTTEGTSNIKHTAGLIDVGTKSIGIYSTTNSNVEMNAGKIHIKDQGIGIYKQNGKVIIKGELAIDKHTATAKDSEPTGVYAVNGTEVNDQASKIAVGEKSYGFILNNTDSSKINVYNNTNTGTVSLTNDSVFLYSNGKAKITNNRTINANASDHLIAFYIKNGGNFINNGNIDFSSGKGNIGIYAPGGEATNKGKILVGKTDDIDPATGKVYTDVSKIVYGIGMAADNGGHIINEGEVRIYNNKSIGMYGSGIGTVVENKGSIKLDGSRATATDKIQSMTGVYVDEGATFRNYGTITTTDSYAGRDGKVNENVAGLTGVAVMNGSTLINEATGKILIDADNSSGVVIRGKVDSKGNVLRYAVIKNYGEIKVRGKGTVGISWKDVSQADIDELQRQINSKITSDPSGNEIGQASGTNKDFQGITITVKNGKPEFKRNGVLIPETEVEQITKLLNTNTSNLGMSNIGFYIDTLGRTKPVDFDGANPPVNSQLIVGTEYSEKTNKKEWLVKGEVIKPFLDQIQGRNFKLTSLAGSLTWIATPVLDNHGQITGIAMSKLSYTSFVKKTDNAYNFTDGLEQRYSMNALDSVEKRIFNKLNSIGKNEEALLTQAYDEMMGHQYANVQQRVQATGKILDKEFTHLRSSWSNPSKDSNKVKTFGMKGEYKTDTAGVIDYTNNAYGVAYVHESEDIKLGKGIGWYTGIVHNTFKFKDIGRSKEEQLQAKVGLFKSVPFDDNNSLNWTISGDIFVGHNKMHRKFLVVDEIFNAKSKYYTYGIGVRNEIGKEFRLSESFTLRPYAALGLEYGRVSKIKEKSGEIKLEVKHNDYLSIKPEVGAELAYKHYFGTKTLRTSVGVAYENELGRVANGKNKARVAGTTADWFNIRGEKEDRRGNVKVDLNVGLDNTRVGVTGNVGYDTKGNNVRGGVGLRVIF